MPGDFCFIPDRVLEFTDFSIDWLTAVYVPFRSAGRDPYARPAPKAFGGGVPHWDGYAKNLSLSAFAGGAGYSII